MTIPQTNFHAATIYVNDQYLGTIRDVRLEYTLEDIPAIESQPFVPTGPWVFTGVLEATPLWRKFLDEVRHWLAVKRHRDN